MLSTLEWTIAFRYLRAKRKEKFISAIAIFSLVGITLGVATLIIVMSVMNGFRTELLNKTLGVSGHVYVTAPGQSLGDYEELKSKITQIKGVESIRSVIESKVLISNSNPAFNRSTGALVIGMNYDDIQSKKIISDNVVKGKLQSLDNQQSPYALLGYKLANRLRVGVGQNVSVVSPKTSNTIFGAVPRKKTYEVAALFDIGMHEVDSNILMLNLPDAQRFLNSPKHVSRLEIMVDDPDKAIEYSIVIKDRLLQEGKSLFVQSWQFKHRHIVGALQTERNMMFIILTLIILIASFNVLTTLIMLVKDKTKAIAILRTMGASKSMIMKIFIICGSVIGFLGTILGFVIGVSFALNIETIRGWIEALSGSNLFPSEIYFLSKLPAEINNSEVLMVVVVALMLSVISTIYPARKAAKIDPAEGLRYE